MDVWGKHAVGLVVVGGGDMRGSSEAALGTLVAESGIYCWLVVVPMAHLALSVGCHARVC